MGDLVLTCDHCGHEMRVPEYALDSKGRCASCGEVLFVSEPNTRPLEVADRSESLHVSPEQVPEEGNVQAAAAAPDVCVRCGRPFRGEWDRRETVLGDMCNICGRLATEGEVLAEARNFQEMPVSPDSYFPREPLGKAEREIEKVPSFAENQPVWFRRALWASALLVIFLAILFSQTTGPLPEVEHTPQELAEIEANIPHAFKMFVFFSQGIFAWFGFLLALYVVLHVENRLPQDSVVGNVLSMLIPSFIITLPIILFPLIPLAIPWGTGLYQIVIAFAVPLFMFVIVHLHYDCRLRGVFLFGFLALPALLIAMLLRVFILGAAGLAFR